MASVSGQGFPHSSTTLPPRLDMFPVTEVIAEESIQEEKPVEETRAEKQARLQKEAIHTAWSIVSRLLDDFGPKIILDQSPAVSFVHLQLKKYLENNKEELFAPLVINKPGSLKSHEKVLLQHTIEPLALFFEDYSNAREAYEAHLINVDTSEKEPSKEAILDDNPSGASPLDKGNIPVKIDFENFFREARTSSQHTLPFESDSIANLQLSQELVIFFRGLFSIALPTKPELGEALANILSPVALVLLDNALRPENIYLCIERLAEKISDSRSGTEDKPVYVDLQQLNDLLAPVKSLLQSTLKIMNIPPAIKGLLGYSIDTISHYISTLLLTKIEKSKQSELSIHPFQLVEKLLYTEKNGKLEVDAFWQTTEETKKEINTNLEGSLENAIRLYFNSLLSKMPRTIPTVLADSCLSLEIHKHLLYLVKNPLLLKLALLDIINSNCKALSHIKNHTFNQVKLLSSISKDSDLQALLREEYRAQNRTNPWEDFELVYTEKKKRPTIIEEAFNKFSRLILETTHPSSPPKRDTIIQNVTKQENWVELWKNPLNPHQNRICTGNQIKALGFANDLFERIVCDYLLAPSKATTPVLRFARSKLLEFVYSQGSQYVAPLALNDPRALKLDEKIYLIHLFRQASLFFEDYALALRTLRDAKQNVTEEALLSIILQARSKKGIMTPAITLNPHEAIFKKLMGLQLKFSILLSKQSEQGTYTRSIQDIGRDILIAGSTLALMEFLLDPNYILYLIHRISTEDIVWDIGLEENFDKISNDATFVRYLQEPIERIIKSTISIGNPGIIFDSLIGIILSLVSTWSIDATEAMLQQINEMLMSDNRSKPFIILNFIFYKMGGIKPEPVFKTKSESAPLFNAQDIHDNLLKRMEEFLTEEISKKNFTDKVMLKAAKSLINDFSQNLIKEIILLTQQTKIFNLLVWDLLTGVDYSLDNLIKNLSHNI
ncbi:MAG: hypothetical protein WC222_04750 [Parachlamydiales bacterium]|jgi:hypothetical protein